MLTVFFRLLCVYAVTVTALRLMGKRQIGELQTGELVVTLFLSETATHAVTDNTYPFIYCLLPPLLLICLEVILSFGATKIKLFKRLFDIPPSILMRNGKINIKELSKNRLTAEELLSQLRLSGYFEMSEISCAVLEPNGQISAKPFDATESGVSSDISRALIIDGDINENALREIGRDKNWLTSVLHQNHIKSEKYVFLLTANGSDKLYIALKPTENVK
ncbi:MAG: DUF421 domain-containing protein [Ruminococcaceae bacterium]|nr:DUF421 domain-containing protein [Oscillospiraceae bacterium]